MINTRCSLSDTIKMFPVASLAVLLLVPCMGLQLYDSDSAIHSAIIESIREFEIYEDLEEQGGSQRAVAHTSVCYDDLGCFERNGTFKHLKQLPDTPENVGTQFLLYTKRNPHEPQIIDYRKPETIFSSNFDKNLPVKVVTHGFGGRNNLTWLWNMKNAFMKMENVNVIVVDWSIGAQTPYYIAAVVNTELVGAQIAALLLYLKDNLGIHEKDMHIIGFSLGAQVCGFVGKRMQNLRRIKPGRITGLDPASPLFEDYGGEVHLFKDDADYVDVVHTNADLLIYGGVGMGTPIGHADYYPNGGKRQPGCSSTISGVFVDMFKDDRQRACNHERAVHLYTETILDPSSCHFVSHPCANYSYFLLGKCVNCEESSSCGMMGYRGHGSGTYYFMTVAEKPFCALNMKLEVKFSEQQQKKKTYGQITVALIGKGGISENVTMSKNDEKLTPGSSKVMMVPVPPGLTPIKAVQILYVKYKGWFAEGTETWNVDLVSLSYAQGKPLFTHCGKDTVLNTMEKLELDSTGHSC